MSAASPTIPVAVFDNGFTLDAVDMPERARPGETMTMRSLLGAAKSRGGEDPVHSSLHLGNAESGEWWVHDQQPLGARLPTRLWYSGMHDSETWQVPLPDDLSPGHYTVFTGLYRMRDVERVPATDKDGMLWTDARIPLGILTIGDED